MVHHNNNDENDDGDERDEEELEEADTTHIQCDAPGCGRWYSGGDDDNDDDDDDDDDGPLPLPPGELASLYEVWHCPSCAPYLGPGTLRRCRQLRLPACVSAKIKSSSSLSSSSSSSSSLSLL